MSEGTRIPRAQACALAMDIVNLLRPFCDRIEVAGSIRRMKADVGDVEIVCIPKAEYNLLGEPFRTDLWIEKIIFQHGYKFIKNGEKFKQFDLGPCKCDLFITTPQCWGVIFMIRTGCAEFSHRLVTPRNAGGLLPSQYQVRDGRIWYTGSVPLDTPEEMDVFNALMLKWIKPEDRIA